MQAKFFRALSSFCLAVAAISLLLFAGSSTASESNAVTAIDIAIDPDATMLRCANSANSELRKNYLDGYAFDASHHAHITLVQLFAKQVDLNKIYDATNRVLLKEKPTDWKLTAQKLSFFKDKGKDTGLECIVVEPTPVLLDYNRN